MFEFHSHLKIVSLVLLPLLSACSTSHQTAEPAQTTHGAKTPMPELIADPYELFNRGVWELNKGLLSAVIYPSSRIYRSIVPEPARDSITKFNRNVTYPGRLANHVLQGRWDGAGDETLRFICNTTVGIGGIFDPASRWDIRKSEADFTETFGKWGWRCDRFIMLPALGPSDNRHALGLLADKLSEPINYYKPYSRASYVTGYNRISGFAADARRLIAQESDSYSFTKYAWTYATKTGKPTFNPVVSLHPPTLETLGAVSFTPNDQNFITRSREMAAHIPTTGRKLGFNAWIQPQPAPLVYLSPGIHSHRLSLVPVALAERLYLAGFSVVSTSSVFHPEFMKNASSSAMPIYAPDDSRDLLVAITEIDRLLMKEYPDQLTRRALVGMSMGGFVALNLAIAEESARSADLMTFDRYVAINTPVDVKYGAKILDEYMNAPLAWPEAERQHRINNTMQKVAYAARQIIAGEKPPTLDEIESKYLIALSFRLGLRDIIFDTQSRNDLGVLRTPLSRWNRAAIYDEIIEYDHKDYFLKFCAPYYAAQDVSQAKILRQANLRNHTDSLRSNRRIHVLVNQNDFLLPANDLSWLKSTFPETRLTVFPSGGHLGNLGDPRVQTAILNSLDGLR
jgi:ABC-type transporter lipoprotein component MlaA/pimeloyl-ACP methyl ester carboxylesterase